MYVIGFIPPDDEYKRKAEAWNACKAAGIEPPYELMRMFDGNEPDPSGMKLSDEKLRECGALRRWVDEDSGGYELVIANLPPDVKSVRFYNSC